MLRARLIFLSLLFLSSCASVGPWEKARLTEPAMQFKQKNPGAFFVTHSVITVEQAEGGDGKAGGGCGCR